MSSPKPKDTELYAQTKKKAMKKFKVYPSIYANAWLVAEYKREYEKKHGSDDAYEGDKPKSSGLPKWFDEEWIDLSRSDPEKDKWVQCGRPKTGQTKSEWKRDYPKCLPKAKAKKLWKEGGKEAWDSAVNRKRAAVKKKSYKGGKPTYVATREAEGETLKGQKEGFFGMRKGLLTEAGIVGGSLFVVGAAMMQYEREGFTDKKWWPYLATFLAGASLHLIYEALGLNKKYCETAFEAEPVNKLDKEFKKLKPKYDTWRETVEWDEKNPKRPRKDDWKKDIEWEESVKLEADSEPKRHKYGELICGNCHGSIKLMPTPNSEMPYYCGGCEGGTDNVHEIEATPEAINSFIKELYRKHPERWQRGWRRYGSEQKEYSHRIVLLGMPASGKGTQAPKLSEKYGVPVLGMGATIRKNMEEQTELGMQSKAFMDAGELVPDELVIGMIDAELQDPKYRKGFVLDGYPRTVPQAERLERITEVDSVIFLTCTEDTVIGRIGGRRSCGDCGAVYHILFNPPKTEGTCDECGSELQRRADDTDEIIRNRIKVFWEKTAPLIDFYESKGLLKPVDANGTPNQVFENVVEALEENERVVMGADDSPPLRGPYYGYGVRHIRPTREARKKMSWTEEDELKWKTVSKKERDKIREKREMENRIYRQDRYFCQKYIDLPLEERPTYSTRYRMRGNRCGNCGSRECLRGAIEYQGSRRRKAESFEAEGKPTEVEVKRSTNDEKKLMAVFTYPDGKTKTTHFGARGMSDYTKHGDKERMERYVDRHDNGREDWADPTTAGALSRWILWNKPSLSASFNDFKKRFNLKGDLKVKMSAESFDSESSAFEELESALKKMVKKNEKIGIDYELNTEVKGKLVSTYEMGYDVSIPAVISSLRYYYSQERGQVKPFSQLWRGKVHYYPRGKYDGTDALTFNMKEANKESPVVEFIFPSWSGGKNILFFKPSIPMNSFEAELEPIRWREEGESIRDFADRLTEARRRQRPIIESMYREDMTPKERAVLFQKEIESYAGINIGNRFVYSMERDDGSRGYVIVKLDSGTFGDYLYISSIVRPQKMFKGWPDLPRYFKEDFEGKGFAGDFLRWLTSMADYRNVPIMLTVDPFTPKELGSFSIEGLVKRESLQGNLCGWCEEDILKKVPNSDSEYECSSCGNTEFARWVGSKSHNELIDYYSKFGFQSAKMTERGSFTYEPIGVNYDYSRMIYLPRKLPQRTLLQRLRFMKKPRIERPKSIMSYDSEDTPNPLCNHRFVLGAEHYGDEQRPMTCPVCINQLSSYQPFEAEYIKSLKGF